MSRFATLGVAAVLITTVAFSTWVLTRSAQPGSLLSPPLIALLLVANLIPAIALMVLYSRRVARQRAKREGLGSGKLHARLVTLFSVLAAVPTVLVAIFASLLFQSGMEFWFSDRARNMLENTVAIPQAAYSAEEERVANETTVMSSDVAEYLRLVTIEDPRFQEGFARQVLNRYLSEAVILNVSDKGLVQSIALVDPYARNLESVVTADQIRKLQNQRVINLNSSDRIGALTRLDYGPNTYLYAARVFDPEFQKQIDRGTQVLKDYQSLLSRSRNNQLRFNGALLVVALVIVGFAIAAALKLADRLVRPMGQLVAAAGRIEEGDFSARVPVTKTEDEIQTLASAFNRMTGRLDEQTSALMSANAQLETRRAFTEAVLSSVTSGVVALDARNRILLINRSAESLLQHEDEALEGVSLQDVSPELDEFMAGSKGKPTFSSSLSQGSALWR
ncbi:HAMP domain-containing protein [Sphingomonas daechungensis]|uniref:HAMP domain-containing protein n=1 Tax=Sphingomonas daechungensis TaxID=1176646 RepID=A0ABX6T124_9SPHN|nr:HAMP domain-containing protein [Sphingomonas daechungensis]